MHEDALLCIPSKNVGSNFLMPFMRMAAQKCASLKSLTSWLIDKTLLVL